MSAIAQSPPACRPATITAATMLLALLGAVGLLAAPGLFFAPDTVWRVLSAAGFASGIATLAPLVLPTSRRAYA